MLHRIAALAFISTFAAGCQPAAPPPDPNLARLVDQQAIAQLIAGTYPNALDKADFDTYAALYTEDGELTLQGNTVKGRAAIKAFVAALPTEPRVSTRSRTFRTRSTAIRPRGAPTGRTSGS